MFTKKILAAAITSQPSANGVADAIDFDGTNDYLSRGSDLAGNTDGKTFTFSAWVWFDGTSTSYVIQKANTGRFYITCSGASIAVSADNSSGVRVLFATIPIYVKDTYIHILISTDLMSSANRHIYINDVTQTVTWTTYTNDFIDFADSNGWVVGSSSGASRFKGRLAHVFLDYTYRDLSIEANRRLFITADRKPTPKATLQGLNPILYLPLDDPTQAGKNLGAGGDFTLNGVVARSGRGPNQFNAVYSDLDGAADYLSRSSIAGITNSRKITVSLVFSLDSIGGNNIPLLEFGSNTSPYYRYFQVTVLAAAKIIRIIGRAPNGSTDVVNFDMPGTIYVGRNYSVVFSFDLDDVNKRHAYLNGVSAATFNTYSASDVNLSISSVPAYRIGASVYSIASFIDGRLGNVLFDTKYIDLSQPANLAKFVQGTGIDAKPVDLGANGELPFGTPPLIYLPMYGNNAGKNYGTGGDFAVNSGPFTGARGPNEFWGNKAVFNGSTGRLNRTAQLSGIADSKTLTFAFSVNKAASVLCTLSDTTGATLRATINSSNQLVLLGKNSSGVTILSATVTTAISNATDASVLVCVDLANAANRAVYLNNVAASVTWATYTNDSIDLTVADFSLGSEVVGANYLNGSLSELYFTTEYIDFSQEANRLKFRDAFGNPVDLRPQIAAGTLPNPAIYMRFDPANFGKNDGTGGDFVVNGTITDGGQL